MISEYFPQDISSLNERVQDLIVKISSEVRDIIAIRKTERNFTNTFYALDALEALFHSKMQGVCVVMLTHSDANVRESAKKLRDRMNAFIIDTFQCNREIYQACLDVKVEDLSEQRKEFLNSRMLSFRREGLHLDEESFNKIKVLKKRIGELETAFGKNLDDDQSHIWVSKEDLEGVSNIVIDILQRKGDQYKLTCDYPIYFPVMRFCQIEKTRRNLYHIFVNRAVEKNLPILRELIDLRDEFAKLLGYECFAAYDVEDQMAKTVQRVDEFNESIIKIMRKKTEEELAILLQKLPKSVTLTDDGKIKYWDIDYLYECYKLEFLNVDEKKLQEYFPFESTFQKILEHLSKLFHLDFKRIPNANLWDPLVQMYAVSDHSQLIGHIIFDLFSRPGKYNHGWCIDVLAPTEIKPAMAVIIFNVMSLLTHSEALTLIHEIGHALHQLLGRAEMPSRSGYHTPSDFLEVPSIFLEELLWNADFLGSLGIPEELIKAKIGSRYFGYGCQKLRQLCRTVMSFEFFKGSKKSTTEIREEIERKIMPFFANYPENNTESINLHLAHPLYRSKYYVYLWSEVYAKDLYKHMTVLNNPWMCFRQKILEAGGGIDPNQLLENFLGRKPSLKAFEKMCN